MLSYVAALRHELGERSRAYAVARKLPHAVSYGPSQVTCFEPCQEGHGNFISASYRAILKNPDWNKRLSKVHTSGKRALPARSCGKWCELDSSNSSDALLMNIFCYPKLLANWRITALLGVLASCQPIFGLKARVPLQEGKTDRTEVDLKLGNLLVESKLTESGFQQRSCEALARYKDFNTVFEVGELPRAGEMFISYQLIRNILAAYAIGCSFCLLVDSRRPDLREAFYRILRCVKESDLRSRSKLLTWQELSGALPPALRAFLAEKYGITPSAIVIPRRAGSQRRASRDQSIGHRIGSQFHAPA